MHDHTHDLGALSPPLSSSVIVGPTQPCVMLVGFRKDDANVDVHDIELMADLPRGH